jgi:hypothetical protein
MGSRQPTCGVGVPEAERLQRPPDPQGPQPSSEPQSAQQYSRLSRLPALCRYYIQLNQQSAVLAHQISGPASQDSI